MAGSTSPSPKARNTTILFVTIISLLLILSYYIFVYVPSHEQAMHEQHIRVLNKIAQNIKSKLNSTISNARNIASYTVRNSSNGELDFEKLNENAGYFNNNITYDSHHAGDRNSGDDSHEHTDSRFNFHVSKSQFGDPGIHISDYVTTENVGHTHVDASGDHNHEESNATIQNYDLTISAHNLVENLLRFDHFEKFALFSSTQTLFETHPTGTRIALDSLVNDKKLINTTHFREVKYGGISHVAYFRPLRFGESQDWVLAGFISSENIAAKKYSLSPLFSIILLLLIVVTLFSIPFIKIKIMHVREHLTLKEVALSFISVTFIVSIIVLLVMMGYTYWGIDKPRIEHELKTLSTSISNALVNEIETILPLLESPQTVCNLSNHDLFALGEDAIPKLTSIENLFFIKDDGWQDTAKKSIFETPTPVIDISSRAYFQKAKEHEILCAEGFSLNGDCFYLESIISYNTGKQVAALSASTKADRNPGFEGIPVVASTGRFYSIIKTILPFGYGFAILNNDGDVLFHSNSNLNLQENFFEEIGTSTQLEAHIFGRSSGVMKTTYHDQSTLLHVAPIKNWPISMVTFHDTSLLSLKYLEVYTLYLTVFMIVFVGLSLIFLLGYLLEKGTAMLWSQRELDLVPSLTNFPPQKVKKAHYAAIMFAYAGLLPIFMLWSWLEEPAISIFVASLLVCIQYWLLRYIFSKHNNHTFWIARLFELGMFSFGSYLFIIHEIGIGWIQIVLSLSLVFLSFGFGWIYHCSHWFKGGRGSKASFLQWVMNRSFVQNTNYLSSYCLTVFLGSLSFGLILTCIIYRACYLQETEAIQKYGLVQFSRNIADHKTEEQTYFNSIQWKKTRSELRKLADFRIENNLGVYYGDANPLTQITTHGDFIEAQNKDSISTLAAARSYLFFRYSYQLNTQSKISTAHIFNDTTSVDNLVWHYADDQLFSTITYEKPDAGDSETHYLSVNRATLGDTHLMLQLLVVLLLGGLVVGGYSMVKQIIRQLFILRKPEKYQFQSREFSENLKSLIALLREQKHLYIVTPPVQLREILNKFDKENYDLIDWADICSGSVELKQDQTTEKRKPLVVTDFAHAVDGDRVQAMRGLRRAMQSTKVILVSNYDPLDLLRRTKEQEEPEARKEHDALSDLLAEFETYYFPLTGDTIKQYQSEQQNQDLLVKEQNIYYELWNSLTPDEQYVLYDLTHDGLVNTRNLPIIHRLYKKGLIVDGGNSFKIDGQSFISSLHIFNQRFSQFVAKLAETENLRDLEEEINATGTWQKYRTPLLITLTGILLFVFITQQDTYGEVVGLLGSIAASLPLLLKLMNSFFAGRNVAQAKTE